jgi:hypothetical protein
MVQDRGTEAAADQQEWIDRYLIMLLAQRQIYEDLVRL